LRFNLNIDYVLNKAHKHIYILKKLFFLHVEEKLRVQCYQTFIQSVFLFHLCTIFGHLSADSKSLYSEVIKLAGRLGCCNFENIRTLYEKAMNNRCLRMVASNQNAALTFDTLPSGRYRTIKSRVSVRSNCFRSGCVKFLNSVLLQLIVCFLGIL
jgi:hypothetical protein